MIGWVVFRWRRKDMSAEYNVDWRWSMLIRRRWMLDEVREWISRRQFSTRRVGKKRGKCSGEERNAWLRHECNRHLLSSRQLVTRRLGYVFYYAFDIYTTGFSQRFALCYICILLITSVIIICKFSKYWRVFLNHCIMIAQLFAIVRWSNRDNTDAFSLYLH